MGSSKISPLMGFGLLEFLVSLGFNLLLIFVLVHVLVSFKGIEQRQNAWLKLQREAYFLSSYLFARWNGLDRSLCDAVFVRDRVHGYSGESIPAFITQREKVHGDVLVIKQCEKINGKYEIKSYAYYVAETKRLTNHNQIVSAFYEKPLGGNRLELEEGIERLQMSYAVNLESGSLIYYSAADIKDWDQVKALHASFVLASHSSSNLELRKPWDIYVYLRS